MALYRGQPANKLTTLKLNIRVCNVNPKHFRIEFDPYLQGPKEANAVQVVLPGGLLQGLIDDGSNQPDGGWLLIDVEQCERPSEPPANLNGWKWE
ncbi:hypothetical protein [Pseudomonas paraglycinae]|uniref:hypothetical protein n=1 Tax=Pseudomonas paraglycinae TaxID=2892330 RepID=UPI001F3805DD|nr:hypothetical protein [Pseudomonas paraglycinae]